MDGRFVPNLTLGPNIVQAIRPHTALPLDVHLMIVEPEKYIDAFAAAGWISLRCTPKHALISIGSSIRLRRRAPGRAWRLIRERH